MKNLLILYAERFTTQWLFLFYTKKLKKKKTERLAKERKFFLLAYALRNAKLHVHLLKQRIAGFLNNFVIFPKSVKFVCQF